MSTARHGGPEPLRVAHTVERLKPHGKIGEKRNEGSLAEREMIQFNGGANRDPEIIHLLTVSSRNPLSQHPSHH